MIFLIIIKNISNSIIGDRALNRFGAGNRPQFSCISKQLKTKIQLQGTKCEQEFELDLKFYFFFIFFREGGPQAHKHRLYAKAAILARRESFYNI